MTSTFARLIIAVAACAAATMAGPVVTGISPNHGSTQGGTRLTVTGTGFDERGRQNDVYIGDSETGVFCDPIPNECHSTRIVCLTDRAPAQKMRGRNSLSVKSFGVVSTCGISNGCFFVYNFDRTPSVEDVFPQYVASTEQQTTTLTVSGQRFAQGDSTVANFDFTMHVGNEERCDLQNEVSWSNYRCQIESLPFPGYSETSVQMGSHGDQRIDDETGKIAVAVYPTILGVTPSTGSPAGGQRVTVFGTSFSRAVSDNVVLVHGSPCHVEESNEQYLVCVTTPHAATTTATRVWTAGHAKWETWYGDINAGGDVERFVFSERYLQPPMAMMKDHFGGERRSPREGTSDSMYQRVTSHFVPNATGNYVFYVKGDDQCELWLSTSEDPVPRTRTQITDDQPLYARRIAFTHYHTNSYYTWPTVQQSSEQTLTVGQKYWMMALCASGGGEIGIQIEVYFKGATPNHKLSRDSVYDARYTGSGEYIPSDFISYSPDWVPPVQVTSGGVIALSGHSCRGWGTCNFNYDNAAAPSIASLTPTTGLTSSSPVTIYGSNFAATMQMNHVWIGGVPCTVTSVPSTQELRCVPSRSVSAGTHRVKVHVAGKGLAIGTTAVTASLVVTSATQDGGRVNIVGQGFGDDKAQLSVTVNSVACPVLSAADTQISCQTAASLTTGTHAVVVSLAGITFGFAPKSLVFDQALVRPGTDSADQSANPIRFWPKRGSVRGNTDIHIVVPGWKLTKDSASVSVNIDGRPCRILYKFGPKITCWTPAVWAPQNGTISVTNGADTRSNIGTFRYDNMLYSVHPLAMSPQGGGVIYISVLGQSFRKDQVAVQWMGAPCEISKFRTDGIECVPVAPSSRPVVSTPQVAAYNSNTANILEKFSRTSTTTVATSGGFVTPADEYLSPKMRFQRPIRIKVKMTPSATPAGSGDTWGKRIFLRYQPDVSSSARGVEMTAAYPGSGSGTTRKYYYRMERDGGTVATKYEDDISTFVTEAVQQQWVVEIFPSAARWYVDGNLIGVTEFLGNRYFEDRAGYIVLTGSQQVTWQDLVVEDLSGYNFKVTINGQSALPASQGMLKHRQLFSPYETALPSTTVTNIGPNTVVSGADVAILGSNLPRCGTWYRGYTQVVLGSTPTSPRSADSLTLCDGAPVVTCGDNDDGTMLRCPVSKDVPAGTYSARFSDYYGFATGAWPVTVRPKVFELRPTRLPTTGGIIEIRGGGMTFDANQFSVTIGTQTCTVVSAHVRGLKVLCPGGVSAGAAALVVRFNGAEVACTSCGAFSYDNADQPIVTGLQYLPLTAGILGSIRIDGTNLGRGEAAVGSQACTFTYVTSTTIHCQLRPDAFAQTAGTAALTVDVLGKGRAKFADGVSNQVQISSGVGAITPDAGATGALVTVHGTAFPVAAGTQVHNINFATAAGNSGWTGMAADANSFSTCGAPLGRFLGGYMKFGSGTTLTNTVATAGAHTHIVVALQIALIDGWWWSNHGVEVTVDGKMYYFDATRARWEPQVGPSPCGRQFFGGETYGTDGVLDVPFVIPHTATNAAISVSVTARRDESEHSWGLMKARVYTLATAPVVVAIGGTNCAVEYMDAHQIQCRAPTLADSTHTVTVTPTGASTLACSGAACTFASASTNGPTPQALTVSAMRYGAGPSNGITWAGFDPSKLVATNGATASLAKKSGSSWDALAYSAQEFTSGSGILGLSATFNAQGNDRNTGNTMIGFSLATKRLTFDDYSEVDFALYFDSSNSVTAYEAGVYRQEAGGPRADSAQLLINTTTGQVHYLNGNRIFYTSSKTIAFPLRVVASLHRRNNFVSVTPLWAAGAADSTAFPVTIGGTNLPVQLYNAPTEPITVTVGGAACAVRHATNGHLTCLLSSALTVNTAHNVVVNNAKGYGQTATLTLKPLIARISHTSGSAFGGHDVTIHGAGFDGSTVVTIGGVACAVTSQTYWQVQCTTGAMSDGAHAVAATVGGVAASCITDGDMADATSSTVTCPTYTASSASDATITGVTPSTTLTPGATITVTGTNFPTWDAATSDASLKPAIKIGGGTCALTGNVIATELSCVLANDLRADATSLKVVWAARGATNAFAVTVPLTHTTNPLPRIGSSGGAKITFTGSGFGTSAAAISVMAGAQAVCSSITNVQSNSFVCLTNPFTLNPAAAGDIVLNVGSSSLNIGLTSASATIIAAAANRPSVTSVAPTTAARGDIVTMSGSNLAGAYSAAFTGSMGTTNCAVQSSTASQVVCRIEGPLVRGSGNTPTATTTAAGVAAPSGASLTGILAVYGTTSPVRAAPGSSVVIIGSGFSTLAGDFKVTLGGLDCPVTAATHGEITCTAPTPSAYVEGPVNVLVRAITSSSAASPVNVAFTAPTAPTVSGVNPTAGSAAGGSILTISGSGFSTTLTANSVLVGGINCPVLSATASELTCTAGVIDSPVASAAVEVTVAGMPSAPGVTFTYQLEVTGATVSGGSATALSVEGGITVTIGGTGFPIDSEKKRASVTIGGKACPITSSSPTVIECTFAGAPRARGTDSVLVQSYTARTAGTHNIRVIVNGTAATINDGTVNIQTTTGATPLITSVTSPPSYTPDGATITIAGSGFAASGNVVTLQQIGLNGGSSSCTVTSQSTSEIQCTVVATTFSRHYVSVTVPGKGRAQTNRACPAGQYLMCDGSCLGDSQCEVSSWGYLGGSGACQDLANLISHETFCHSNGGTDRVNLPLKTDSGSAFNLNCPMYNCEGGDCDTTLSIGGRGGRVSTCLADPNGFVVDVKPGISSIGPYKTSGTNGGLRLTITGTGLSADSIVRVGLYACPILSNSGSTQLVCEMATSSGVEIASATLGLWRSGVQADCPSACTGFAWTTAATPQVTAIAGEIDASGRALCKANTPITLQGSGFNPSSADNYVYINGVQATVSTSTSAEIVFACPTNGYGWWPISLRVGGKGLATWPTGKNTVQYIPTVTAISTVLTSQAGGKPITITGTGLFRAGSTSTVCAVNVGTTSGCCLMTVVSTTPTEIQATTGACAEGVKEVRVVATQAGSGSSWSVCADATNNCRLTSNLVNTPVVSTSSKDATSVTLNGDFRSASQPDVSVKIGYGDCTITVFSQTSLTCTAPTSHQAGTYNVKMTVAGFGAAYVDPAAAQTWTYTMTATSVTPSSGSLGGDQLITIVGTNFANSLANQQVSVGTAACTVSSVTPTQIVCKTSPVPSATGAGVTLSVSDSAFSVQESITGPGFMYDTAKTPTITGVSPNRGSTAGGTYITLTGTNLALETPMTITIANIACTQDSAQLAASNGNELHCTTGAHATDENPNLRVATPTYGIAQVGSAAKYQYLDLWSRHTTWGGGPLPIKGDSVTISSGQTVILDISPPQLFLIIVMGHFKFDNVDLALDCTYIMINFGRMTVGTPSQPHTAKATITLHGDRLTPEIPVHGAKVLALRHGALDMHGIVRDKTWTQLTATANEHSETISVRGPIDWQVGETIVIASTDYKVEHAEERTISAITNGATATITLNEPLHYMHYGERQCFGSPAVCVDEVAEVILLTRNVVVQGDENTKRYGFGGTMFLMPMGQTADKYARLSYIEMRDVGQQYIVGRYPVHFHVTHDANTSYVNGTSVHRSLNRAYSIHGVNNNTYVNNVVYDTHGHAFFIEDGSEKYNVIENNVVIMARSSTSNLNTDITPANFWVVSPLNKVVGNRACGGHAYGFWIAPFHPHSTGPTHSTSICPSTHPMWDFRDNVAHSNAKYGLNIFQFWWPKVQECNRNSADKQATIVNHFSYKNKIHGVTSAHSEVGSIGAVIWDNLISADNGLDHPDASAFWTEHSELAGNMTFGVRNSVLIALTNNDPYVRSLRRRAINLPLGDNFFSENITFVNWDGNNFGYEPQAWASRFSFCFPWGWSAVSKGLRWIDSPNRILYRFDHHGHLYDEDGTLSGTPNSQIVTKTTIFDPAQCPDAPTTYNTLRPAIVCNGNYKIRRFGVSNTNEIWKDQLWTIDGRTELVPEIKHEYSVIAPINKNVTINFQHSSNPSNWMWRIDDRYYQPTEKMMFASTDLAPRYSINASFDGRSVQAMLVSWPTMNDATSGYYREGGSLNALLKFPDRRINGVAASCPPGGCPAAPAAPPTSDRACTPWNVASSWASGAVPAVGADVHITYRDSICLTGQAEYSVGSLLVEGKLELLNEHCPTNGTEVVLRVAKFVHLRGGIFRFGNHTHPLTACKVRIAYGMPDFFNQGPYTLLPWSTRAFTVENGKLQLYGRRPNPIFSQLAVTAPVGTTTIQLTNDVQWAVGDKIVIAGTTRQTIYKKSNSYTEESEERTIANVAGNIITIDTPLRFSHIGELTPQVINGRQVMIGAEVAVLARTISIGGANTDRPQFGQGWNLNIGCTDANTLGCGTEGNGFPMSRIKTAEVQLSAVLLQDVGQEASFHAGVEVDGLISGGDNTTAAGSFISECAIVRAMSHGIAIRHTTSGFNVTRNVIYKAEGDGVRAVSSGNSIDGNLVVAGLPPLPECDFTYQFIGGAENDCRPAAFRVGPGNFLHNNVAASLPFAGYLTDGDHCTAAVDAWSNNVAHSVRDGVLVYENPADPYLKWNAFRPTCRLIRGVTAHNAGDHGVVAWYVSGNLRVQNILSVHNQIGFSALMHTPDMDVGQVQQNVQVRDSTFAGHWNGHACNAELRLRCRPSLLDSEPWCVTFQSQRPFMGSIGILESVFTMKAFGNGRTKGEHKFMFHEPDSYATLKGRADVQNVHFANFNGNDACGLKDAAFYQNPYSNDTFHHHTFRQISWSGIQNGGQFWARKMYGNIEGHLTVGEQSRWLDFDNIKFGAYWPDAPNKVWLADIDGSFTGRTGPANILASETMIRDANFAALAGGWDGIGLRDNLATLPIKAGCVARPEWNATVCDGTSQQLVSLSIEHLGDDQLTRRAAPVVLCKGDGMIGRNGHPLCPGGSIDFASGPVMKGKVQRATLDRLSRWRFVAQHGGNYTLYFRGQPPAWMRLWLANDEHLSLSGPAGITVNVRYFGLNSQARVGVYHDGVRQRSVVARAYPWQLTPPAAWPNGLTDVSSTHFHNKLVDGEQNLEINVMSVALRADGLSVDLRQEPIIFVNMDVSVPVDEFFNNKDTFAAAMAHVLGISEARMKFVDIVPGTTRRRQLLQVTSATGGTQESSNSAVSMEIEEDPSVSEASARRGRSKSSSSESDLPRVMTGLRNLTEVNGYRISNVQAELIDVEIPEPLVTIEVGYSFILINCTAPASTGFNRSLVTQYLSALARRKHTTLPQNATVDDETAVANVWTDNHNFTRFTINFAYGVDWNVSESNRATTSVHAALVAVEQVLPPGYIINSFSALQTGQGAPAPTPSPFEAATPSPPAAQRFFTNIGGDATFLAAAIVGLVVLVIGTVGCLYYFLVARPKRLMKEREACEPDSPSVVANPCKAQPRGVPVASEEETGDWEEAPEGLTFNPTTGYYEDAEGNWYEAEE